MNRRIVKDVLLLVLGVMLVVVGGFVLKEKWSGVLIGLGAGLFGKAGSQVIVYRMMRRDPELRKKAEIEASDERNIQINHYAKAKAFDFSTFLALPFFLILILVSTPLWIVLLAVGVYAADFGVYIWFLNKKMNEI